LRKSLGYSDFEQLTAIRRAESTAHTLQPLVGATEAAR
jgi:hypothetical protein